jgi:hypothetical protein
MHKSQALARQVYPKYKENWLLSLKFNPIYWITLSILSGTFGYIIQSFNNKSLRDLLELTGFSIISGPRQYFEYFWAHYIILKIFSSYLIYSKTSSFLCMKDKSIKDLALSILFFIEYRVIKYIYLTYSFKLSGHCLILIIGSSVIDSEGILSDKYLEKDSIQLLTKFLLFLNYYFFIWTSTVYHSLPESLSGTVLGLLTLLIINKLLSR